jgi:hypothetical protein
MDREPVDSTSIGSVAYDPESLTLELEFLSGGVYEYFGVPHHVHDDLMAAESIGAFVSAHIVHGRYPYRRVSA